MKTRRAPLRIALLSACLLSCPPAGRSAAGNDQEPGPANARAPGAGLGIRFSNLRWTFGNHEPLAMYRRVGRESTAGVPGGALWLERWHRWYDSEECVDLMQRLGFNILHSRFYKGFGWEFERRDFPDVRRFVARCHRHGILTLAYVQFGTLYHEVMRKEIPELRTWAAVDRDGRVATYHGGAYWRWMPCVTSPDFADYLERMIDIALTQGGFDGVLFDNAVATPCHCPRCQALFREHVRSCRFDFLDADCVQLPPDPAGGEVEDPIAREAMRFRHRALADLFARLHRRVKGIRPDAIVTANIALLSRPATYGACGLNPLLVRRSFDFILSQSGNEPALADGCVISQVREQKLGHALGTKVVTLNDSDAGGGADAGARYVCGLFEALFAGGIPVDRTIMKPLRGGAFNREIAERRRPILDALGEITREFGPVLDAPAYEPVGVLFPVESQMFSERSVRNLLQVEESLLRAHVPYRLLAADGDGFLLENWGQCETIIVPGQLCISDNLLALLRTYRGRLVLAGEGNGDHDEHYRQRADDPFAAFPAADRIPITEHKIRALGWTTRLQHAPDDWGTRFKTGVEIDAPPHAHAEVKIAGDKIVGVLLTSPAPGPVSGVKIRIRTDLRAARYRFRTLDAAHDAVPASDTFAAPPFSGMIMLCAP